MEAEEHTEARGAGMLVAVHMRTAAFAVRAYRETGAQEEVVGSVGGLVCTATAYWAVDRMQAGHWYHTVALAVFDGVLVAPERAIENAAGDGADRVDALYSEAWEVGMARQGVEGGCTGDLQAAGIWAAAAPMAERCVAAEMPMRAAVVWSSVAGRDWAAAASGERQQFVHFAAPVPLWIRSRAAVCHLGAAHSHGRRSAQAADWPAVGEASAAGAVTFSAA